jgi:hypothetical protein
LSDEPDFHRDRLSSSIPPPPSRPPLLSDDDIPPPPPPPGGTGTPARSPPGAVGLQGALRSYIGLKPDPDEVSVATGAEDDDDVVERESSFAPPPPANPQKLFADFKKDITQRSINDFIDSHFAPVKKGMMGGKVSNEDLITFGAKAPKAPLLKSTPDDKRVALNVLALFTSVMVYMGDAKQQGQKAGSFSLLQDICQASGRDSDPDVVAAYRAEVLSFLIKQTNGNPNQAAIVKGYEVAAMILRGHSIPNDKVLLDVWRRISLRRRADQSAVGGLSNVIFHALLLGDVQRLALGEMTVDDLEFARTTCIAPQSPFDCSLEQVLRYEAIQANPLSTDDPLRLYSLNKWCPRLMVSLIDVTKVLGGNTQNGIFRLASDKDAIIALKDEIATSGYRMLTEIIKLSRTMGKGKGKVHDNLAALKAMALDSAGAEEVYTGITMSDPNESADLLKQWLRGLKEPLIPYAFYQTALDAGKSSDVKQAVALFKGLMGANQASIDYLMDYLVDLLEYKESTLMDENALAIVFSPNLLKNPTDDAMSFARNSDHEKRFVMKLIEAKKQDLLLRS